MRLSLTGLAALLGVAVWTPAAQAQQGNDAGTGTPDRTYPLSVESSPRPEARAIRTNETIVIDGRPDEAAWRDAEIITDFIQSVPSTGMPGTENTVVRVLYDENRLYISAVCYESDMSGIIVPSIVQDFETHDSDMFGVTIDTYLDRRNAFMFLVNPGGALKDGQVYDNSRNYNIPWEGVIDMKVALTDSAWTVEMAIPFTTLRFDPTVEVQDWGFQFSRRIRRKSEDTYWAPLARRELIHRMSRAGTIRGFRGMRPGRNLSVKPYGVGSAASGSLEATGAASTGFDGGFDVKYGITSRLTADATFRTDFSQVEVDQERVNLTRFSLFFPEKRDFFLENAGTFTFGDVSERNIRMGSSLRDFTLFHSRTIGLDGRGLPIPILGGGRVTGQAGGWNLGLMNMQTQARDSTIGPENFTVARIRRNVGGNADVGAIFVNRQATDGAGSFNRSFGVDANIPITANLILNSYLAAVADTSSTGDHWAGRLSVAWRDRVWDASAFYKQVGDAFAPSVGYVRRAGVRHTYATLGAHPTPAVGGILEVNPYAEISRMTDLTGVLVTRDLAAGLGVDFENGSKFTSSYTDRFELLDRQFVLRRDASGVPTVVVPAAAYDFGEFTASYQSNAGKPFSGKLEVTRGGYFSGDRTSLGLGALWRVNRHLAFDLFADRNTIALPDTTIAADVYGGRVNVALSTRLITSAFVQYNGVTDEMFSNVRINFIHAPLSDIFLVYTERRNWATKDRIDHLLSLKVTHLLAF
ncbi:MAG: carbohydrate binding family 9 domain-containing protein [Gemmatimonadota bacterium]|nr:carbohydrate binding family 9 domain-containing protein [Gemmatimonadota bacterium]